MSEMMTFPDTWEEFEKSYGFTDNEEVYTNGARLIPSFRVKQWLEHLPYVQPELSNNSQKLDTENGELISRQELLKLPRRKGYAVNGWEEYIRVDDIKDLLSVKPTHTTPSNTLEALDCVDRAEAIKAVKFYETFCDPYPRVIETLEELPSIQPDKDLIHLQKEQAYMQGYEDGQKPRKGKWINIQQSVTGDSSAECDQCGAIVHDNFLSSSINFCPNCGADMREGDAK